MFKIFKKKDDYYDNGSIRPWVIEQYKKLKLAQFSHDEIISTLSLNVKEKEFLEKQNDIFGEVIDTINKAIVEETVKEVKENNEVIDAEIVKETVVEEPVKEVKENNEVIDAEIVKETVVEEDPSKWTDEKIIEKAVTLLTKNIEYQDKEQMSNLLKESFNTDKGLIDLYRNKFLSEYKANKNDIKSTENTKKEDKKEIESIVIENKDEKEIESTVIENKDEKAKKVKDEDTDDLNIDNETFEMLVDDVYDQYSALFNIKKDALRNLIISVLKEKPEILKATNYYFVCMRLCEIIENLIMENTIEDNEEDDEILKQLNSIVE